jgi:hypothetical protein
MGIPAKQVSRFLQILTYVLTLSSFTVVCYLLAHMATNPDQSLTFVLLMCIFHGVSRTRFGNFIIKTVLLLPDGILYKVKWIRPESFSLPYSVHKTWHCKYHTTPTPAPPFFPHCLKVLQGQIGRLDLSTIIYPQ